MTNTVPSLMTADDFLLWCLRQEDRFELVDGVPVRIVEEIDTPDGPRMMTGASDVHDRIVVNVIIALGNQLRGTPCRPATADLAVRTKIRSVRRPDVTVTCDPPLGNRYEVSPKLIVEVLSPSNRGVPWQRKLDEYWRLDAARYVLLVESQEPRAVLYTRSGPAWDSVDAETLADVFELPGIGCRLAMADIYEGLDLPTARPADAAND
jgi:Uma2 family endonuclease